MLPSGAQIENKAYDVTVDPLHTVFSPYGTVQKMAIFEKNGQWQVILLVWLLLHGQVPPGLYLVANSPCLWTVIPRVLQALVQYSNPTEAANAKAALEGHAIYDGGYNRVRRSVLSTCNMLAICLQHALSSTTSLSRNKQ